MGSFSARLRVWNPASPDTVEEVEAMVDTGAAFSWIHRERLERLGATCTVVGLFDKWECTLEERELAPGDTILLYTDGVTEAVNGDGEEFGEERLLEAARQHSRLSLPDLLAALADQARRFSPLEQADDITLIVAKCT